MWSTCLGWRPPSFVLRPAGGRSKRVFNLAQTGVLLPHQYSVVHRVLCLCTRHRIGVGHRRTPRVHIQWLTVIMLIDATVAIPFAQLRLQSDPSCLLLRSWSMWGADGTQLLLLN